MNLYFYTNKNILFDFLGRNIIAPDSIVKDIKKYRTISTASDSFLFVTHKRLNRKSREYGIAEPEFVYPVTLELSEIQQRDGQAILVSNCESGLKYTLTSFSDYNPNKHVGAYLIGEIPFSRVEKIYFDSQDDIDMFSRPSPDYWYPTNKFGLLPEGFVEEFSIILEEDKIIEASGLNREEIIPAFRKREKIRAAILNLINGTRKWQYGRYLFNMDSKLQQLFSLEDKDITSALPHYQYVRDKDNVEHLCLTGEHEKQNKKINQTIYNHIYDVLIGQSYNTQKQPELLKEILDTICEKIVDECTKDNEVIYIRNKIEDIENLILDISDKGPEDIMADISEEVDVLKSLMFVMKNPNHYDPFLAALDAYHADLLTRRRAMVLWGLLNGLYGMPGEDFNKDNQQLWQFIEAFTLLKEELMIPSLSVEFPLVSVKKGVVLGILLKEERIITAGEVREEILAVPKEKLPTDIYKKLFGVAEEEFGGKKKAENKGYAYYKASIPLDEIKKGDELTSNIRKKIEKLSKDCKIAVPHREKLLEDYVKNERKFMSVFNMDPDYWKGIYKIILEKRNA